LNTYTLHINTYDLAFFATIFVALTFILLLWFTKKMNRAANRFLALALVTIVLWIARILGIDTGLSAYFANWSRLPLQFSLALGPLIYFYVFKITRPEYKLRAKYLLHFSPLLLELCARALAVRESIKTGAATYETPIFRHLNPALQMLAFVSVTIYLYLAHQLITRFYQQQKFNGGDRYRHQMRWLHHLLLGFGVVWLLWIPFAVADYYYPLGVHFYYPLYFLLGVITIWMAARAFSRPEIRVPLNAPLFLKPAQPAELRQKGAWLKKVMQANRYYQDMELSLSSLAEKLGLTPHELSPHHQYRSQKKFQRFY
jgi:putative ABC transport system permease protein